MQRYNGKESQLCLVEVDFLFQYLAITLRTNIAEKVAKRKHFVL